MLSHDDEFTATHRDAGKYESSPVIPIPSGPRPRRSTKSKNTEEIYSPNNNIQSLHMEGKKFRGQNTSTSPKNERLSKNQNTSYDDTQMTESSSEEDEEAQVPSSYSRNHSETFIPESYSKYLKNTESSEIKQKKENKQNLKKENEPNPKKENKQNSKKENEQNPRSKCYFFIFLIVPIIVSVLSLIKNEVQTQSISDPTLLLSESIEKIKTTFHNQESDIWNDISSAINEVISRTPKRPSIILLFAKETTTMDCLATELAYASSTILHADGYLDFNPENFGNDAGEIITTLNEHPPEKKKVVMIRDILNINAEAIKALHNLCDRINPLVAEALYILTMETNNYQSSQKELDFVENQLYNKLSKSIDRDVLKALVVRITDGAIISIQPEPQLRYC